MAEIFTLSLGDTKQYSATLTATPTLTGSRIVFTDSPSPNDGVDVILSDELRGKVESALDSACVDLDDVCFESIKDILVSPNTELETRQVEELLYGVGAAVAVFFAYIIPVTSNSSKGVPVALHAPAHQLGPAASAAQASTVAIATASDAPIITITRKPDATLTTATDAPHQTMFTNSANNGSPGDIEIYIPEALGKRMTELIDRSQQCTIDDKFSSSRRARSLDFSEQLTGVICSTKQVLLNASPGAAFEALDSLGAMTTEIPTWIQPDVQEAMEFVMNMAKEMSDQIMLYAHEATLIALFVFMVNYQRSVTGSPISPSIRIPGSELKEMVKVSLTPSITSFTPTSSMTSTVSSSSSSSTQECSAFCSMIGQIKRCTTQCPKMTDLPTATPTEYAVRTMTVEPWIVPYQPQIPIKDVFSFCMPNEDTKFPVSEFNVTYADFCEKADGSTEDVTWMVNAKGEQSQLNRRRFWRRDSSDDFSDYKFALWWRPKTGDNATDCEFSCEEAFQGLTERDSCSVGDGKKFLAGSGGIDIGCGTYSFTAHHQIDSTVKCLNHPLDAPKNDKTTSGGVSVESAIRTWCSDNDGHQFSSNAKSDNVYWRWGITQLDVPDRRSFWLRAKPNGNNQQASFVKDECIAALTNGLSTCDPNSDNTHGFTATVGTIDYSLDLSGVTQLDNPPWNEHPAFPAPEFLTAKDSTKPHTTQCWDPKTTFTNRKIAPDDIEKAISAWCKDGTTIDGFGNNADGFMYPPEGETPFYPNDHTPMHMRMNVATVETGEKEPYGDMEWCE
ncbi:hypothetical protein J4E85_007139 [Alternaria conjuncta]|uniref:uncharacterized protein n=1 Tax=Alternaria conjuncta TaxID=181017 RepID=UPI00221F92C6|nr:uncharacterized protein J4E85_007139 [Alternaria conjuncta]KAI4925262.1 hypothetical protein J4E85_007139 [Alternaria conjuncta]